MQYLFSSKLLSVLLFGLIVFGATFAVAQGIVTGSISGIVQDPQGALIPGANVSATHLATNREFKAQTNATGVVELRNLPPGTYSLRIEASNFLTYQANNVSVNVGQDTSLGNVKLELGSSSQTITVEAAAPLIESTTDKISATFSAQKVADLPMGNTFDSLALFVPGIATAGDASFSNNNGAELSANGQRARSNNFQIDGQSNNDNSIGGPDIFFGNQDAIAEIQVVTNYDAEFGRNTGAVVNYVTKSGTNHFHGAAYWIWGGSTFDSLTNQEKSPVFGFCAPGVPPSTGCTEPTVSRFVENRFGGAVGGPIKRDKIWFFGSTNVFRFHQYRSPALCRLPKFLRDGYRANTPGGHSVAGGFSEQPHRLDSNDDWAQCDYGGRSDLYQPAECVRDEPAQVHLQCGGSIHSWRNHIQLRRNSIWHHLALRAQPIQ